ncbi:CRISPR-associated protein Cas4 [Microbulbifer halophilus]|uniref:CRISPR-associated exonuclease Cas4 n=1 Tax=Microbulbifer halophilus TaxID=453963 RepID=A0ABW5EA27_9GAMM|nr:CRISPR-associated protein Cas4 [Microbulbifer halophilus]MCW8125115.1 CRISPR-associated protein Cas4 [Microbulbifer halophilus]
MDDLLPISALQHYSYCPRQFALIHVDQVWAENRYTAEGRILHERVDSGAAEQRRDVRFERSVMLRSELHRLTGKLDLLEVHGGERYIPVEYKRGKPKIQDWDRIQVCAQALCIEEMRSIRVEEGAIWYWEVRRREVIELTEEIRKVTIAAIESCHRLIERGVTPQPTVEESRCRACSLRDQCRPDRFRRDGSAHYTRKLFEL